MPRENISLERDTFYFTAPDKSPTDIIDVFRRFYGPTMNAFDAAEKNGKWRICTINLWNWCVPRTRARTGARAFPRRFCG